MIEDLPVPGRWIVRAFQNYWRTVRGMHLFVAACVIDEAGSALMVQNESGGTWELPQGIVRKDENLEMALRRMLRATAGIEVNAEPELSFFYARSKSEQTGLYRVGDWKRSNAFAERETRFFPPAALPADIDPGTAERIRRCVRHRTTSEV